VCDGVCVPLELPQSGGDDGEQGLAVDYSIIVRLVLRYAPILNHGIRLGSGIQTGRDAASKITSVYGTRGFDISFPVEGEARQSGRI
jgi:hypothetical protein